MKIIFLIGSLLLISLSWSATLDEKTKKSFLDFKKDNILYYGRLYFNDSNYYIALISRHGGMDHLSIIDQSENIITNFSADSVGNPFRSIDIKNISSYGSAIIITVWNKGAHGSMIRLFDPKKIKENPIFERNSSWNTDYLVGEDGFLQIFQKSDQKADASFENFNLKWPNLTEHL